MSNTRLRTCPCNQRLARWSLTAGTRRTGEYFAFRTAGGGIAGLDAAPERLATLDGFKVESVVVDDVGQVFVGTDDEDLGNVLRPLP